MVSTFTMQRRVEFSETDMAGIVHFANIIRYMESAEHAFFRSLGHSVHPRDNHKNGWPRVNCQADFHLPLYFEDLIEIRLTVARKGAKSLTFKYHIFRLEGEERVLAASGSITSVHVDRDPETGKMRAMAIPASIADQIEETPEF